MPKDLERKAPPQSLDAEMALLGAMLIEKDAILKAQELVKEEDFYKEVHKLIFATIIELSEKEVAEPVTITNRLKNNKLFNDAGGMKYLFGLTDTAQTAANVEYYANIVKDKSILRQIITVGSQMVTDAFSEDSPSETILDEAQTVLFNIAKQNSVNDFSTPQDLILSVVSKLENLFKDRNNVPGLRTGFSDLDKITAGLQPSELIIIAGRPSMGKTAFALNIAEYVAIMSKEPKSVAIFSLEMSKESLMMRFLASVAQVSGQELRKGNFKNTDWQKLTAAMEKIAKSDMYICDADMTSIEIRATAKKLATKLEKKGKPLSLIIIDYLQLIRGIGNGKKYESKQIETAEISRSLKALAKDLNVPVVALSQLSRQTERRGKDTRPMLSDLRDSGAIEQDADVVAFVHRESYFAKDKGQDLDPAIKNDAEIIIAKQRNGPVDTVHLLFEGNYTKFYDKAPISMEENQ